MLRVVLCAVLLALLSHRGPVSVVAVAMASRQTKGSALPALAATVAGQAESSAAVSWRTLQQPEEEQQQQQEEGEGRGAPGDKASGDSSGDYEGGDADGRPDGGDGGGVGWGAIDGDADGDDATAAGEEDGEGEGGGEGGTAAFRGTQPPFPPLSPLTLSTPTDQQVKASERCVFVLGTGRSGSTQLVDALNQLPRYFIRGEQAGAFWHLYLMWRMMGAAWKHATDIRHHVRDIDKHHGTHAAGHIGFASVKEMYGRYAVQKKLPWFNDLHPSRVRDAVRATYSLTYGHHGPGYVSGFKEIRYVRGRAFPSPGSTYQDFSDFVEFLRLMCDDVKVLLNSRVSQAAEDNLKLSNMLTRHGIVRSADKFQEDLEITHQWYNRYVSQHRDHAFRVLMEDMFDAQKNATLARRLLSFLGEDPNTPISFDRMPTWTESVNGSRKRKRSPKMKADMKTDEHWRLRIRMAL